MQLLFLNEQVVKILGYGLSGFAFLLMFFAFLLLRQVISKEKETNKLVFKSIWAFMALSFVMTITIGIFSFFVNDYKENVIAKNTAAVDELLKVDQLKTNVSNEAMKDPEKFAEVKDKQQEIVNELDSIFQQSGASEEEKKEFSETAKDYIRVTDELAKSNISPQKRDTLAREFRAINLKMSGLSTNRIKKDLNIKPSSAVRNQ